MHKNLATTEQVADDRKAVLSNRATIVRWSLMVFISRR